MKRRFSIALFALVLGVLVSLPQAVEAQTNMHAELRVIWVNLNPWNIAAEVRFFNLELVDISGWEPLTPNAGFDTWTTDAPFIHLVETAAFVEFRWNIGVNILWDPFPGVLVDVEIGQALVEHETNAIWVDPAE